jgi:hypothetical protein
VTARHLKSPERLEGVISVFPMVLFVLAKMNIRALDCIMILSILNKIYSIESTGEQIGSKYSLPWNWKLKGSKSISGLSEKLIGNPKQQKLKSRNQIINQIWNQKFTDKGNRFQFSINQ